MFDSFFGGSGIPLIFLIPFVLILAVFVFILVKGIGTWRRNERSPRLSVDAVVTSKRTEVTHRHQANAGDITGAHGYSISSTTWYYVTFQVESGDRMELAVDGEEYGMLAEGDFGKLSFQGTRYLGFERC